MHLIRFFDCSYCFSQLIYNLKKARKNNNKNNSNLCFSPLEIS